MKNFITFEGGEGCGKSTIIKLLSDYLTKNNVKHILTREPGGLPECEEIRRILLSSKELSAKTQVLLFSSCRSHLVEKLIKPALDDGNIVLCDRFYDSTRVYQGYSSNISDEEIMKITDVAVGEVKPQITFFFDLDPRIAFKRKNGADKGDVFEERDLSFHDRVREGFKNLAAKETERFRIIDTTKSIDEVLNEVIEILKKENVI